MPSLHVRIAGEGPTWEVWPLPEVIPPGTIREGSTVYFELLNADSAVSIDLYIDDHPIEALRSREPSTARWRWEPGFNAGVVEASLHIPGVGTKRFDITTDADVRKLTRDDFDVMVREILEDTFALFSLNSFRKGFAQQRGNKPPPIARLEFLRTRVDEILNVVAQIDRSPRHVLVAELATVPANRARRVTGQDVAHSFRLGNIRTESPGPSRLPSILGGRLPAQIVTRQRRNSVDTAEHRQIKATLRAWAAWLFGVADTLAKLTATDDPEGISITKTWAVRTRKLGRKLQIAASSGFMRDVGDGAAALTMTSLFRRDPVYRRFYRIWQDMNLGLAALFGEFLQMPIARTYQLYELWCFFRLLRAAVAEYGSTHADMSTLFTADASGGLTISAGAVTVPIDRSKTLCFQRQYKEYWNDPLGEGSFSRAMIPDVVLAGSGFGGPSEHVIILDAKYRINDGLNDALGSIHMYRDALVRGTTSGEEQGIVTAAYLITPHIPELKTSYRATAMPGRLFHPEYRERFRFGAVTLRPGMAFSDIQSTLRAIISDATGTR